MDKGKIEDAPVHLRRCVLEMRARLKSVYNCKSDVSIAGARCAVLLERWLGGMHHMTKEHHPSDVDWSDWSVMLQGRSGFYQCFDSFDGSGMTSLVLLAHEHIIRVELQRGLHQARAGNLLLTPRVDGGTNPMDNKHRSLVELREMIDKRLAEIAIETSQHAMEHQPRGDER